jgi:hypothetical protein
MATSVQLATAAWGLASAVALVLLGALTMRGGAARVRGAFAFGLFALVWGAQIGVGNAFTLALSTVSGATDVTSLNWIPLVFLALHLPLPYLLLEFAVSQVSSRRVRWQVVRWLAAALGMANALVLLFAPELLFQGIQLSEFGAVPVYGPLFPLIVIAPQYVAFALALIVLNSSRKQSPTPRTADRAAILVAGLGVYFSFAVANNAAFYSSYLTRYPLQNGETFAVLFAILSIVVVWIGWQNARLSVGSVRWHERRRDLAVAAALLLPLLIGGFEGVYTALFQQTFESVGLWRLLGVGIIAYGLARWRLFDLPQRAAKTAATAAGASGSLVTGVATYGLATLVTTSALVPAFLGLAVVGASFIPGIRMARKLFSRFTNEDGASDDVVYGQRVEAYRAALEASLARGNPEEDAEFLGALRERFGISESEDRLLRYYARSAVLVPRNGDGGAAYERLRLLGEGGAGRTWLARDRVRDRLVVLKEPLGRWQREDAVREMVLREARLAAKVRHPNVIAVEEVVEDKGLPVIVMEHVEGGSLADLLRERGVLPWREAVELTVQVLRGVEAVHQSGIIHRDLKPSNVLLGADGTPKVADFGIATLAAPSGEGKTVVEGSTTFQGTIAYVAPEVRAGATGDRRADVYSCGALLHECLHGSPPGPGMPVLASNEVPPRVEAAMARAIHQDATQRFPTARAFADELVAVMRP